MQLMRSFVIAVVLVLASPAIGSMFGGMLLGRGGDVVGAFAGLAAGLYLLLRYIADMRAIAVASRNADNFLNQEGAKAESRKVIGDSVRDYLRSSSWRATAMRRLVSDQNHSRGSNAGSAKYHSRLSDFDKRQAYDLQMPRGMGKRKGKPKRQRWS